MVVLVGSHAVLFAWNFARAADRLQVEDREKEIAELQGRVDKAEAAIPLTPNDEEIIASFSDRTTGLLRSGFGKQLARGDLSARMFEDFVVSELVENGLATITQVSQSASAPWPATTIPYLNLTERGHRVLRKLRES
jgi:hypothetical protein